MYKHLFNKVIVVFSIMITLVFLTSTIQAAPVLSMAPSGESPTNNDFYLAVNTFDTFTIDIYFDLPTSEYPSATYNGMYATSFNLNFDPNYLEVNNTSYNTAAFEDSTFSNIIVYSNYIDFAPLDNFGTGFDGQFLVGSVTFNAKSSLGTTYLTTSDTNPSIAGDFYTQNFTSLDSSVLFKTGEIEISEVPIPGALWLLGSGLIGMVGIRRKLGKS
jgi:hypothetical protein